jgi:uncharacterized protein YyaL (SSP411 family)
MLSDNLGLLQSYTEAYRLTGDDWIRDTAGGIVREITSGFSEQSGLFHSVQDSDGIPGDPSSYYGWSEEEIQASIEDQATVQVLLVHFGFHPTSLIPGSRARHALEQRVPVSQVALRLGLTQDDVKQHLSDGLEAMKRARAERIAPGVDAELYTAAQGASLGPLAHAALLLDRPILLQRAFEVADHIWEHARSPHGGVRHRFSDENEDTIYLVNQVEVINGYLELYKVSGRANDLTRGIELLSETLEILGDDQGPGCFDHLERETEYGVMKYKYTPFEANSKLLLVLSNAARLTQESRWHDRAMTMVGGLEEYRPQYQMRDAAYGRALRRLVTPPPMVDLITGEGVGEMRRKLLEQAPAGTLIRAFDPDQSTPWTRMEKYPTNGNQARAVVHVGTETFEPTHDVELALYHLNELE